MSKKSIDHRYSIEYIYPADSSNETTKKVKKGKIALFIFLMLIALLFAFFIKNEHFSNYVPLFSTSLNNADKQIKNAQNELITDNTVNSTGTDDNKKDMGDTKNTLIKNIVTENTAIKPSKVKKSAVDNKIVKAEESIVTKTANTPIETDIKEQKIKTEDESKNFQENNELISSLDKLTEQLIAERKKNKNLENKLKENNNNLSKLLTESLDTANTKDKDYISALQELAEDEKESAPKEKEATKKIIIDNKVVILDNKIADSKLTVAKETQTNSSTVDYNNSVDLSMESQVNAILLTMKSLSSSRSNKIRKLRKASQKTSTNRANNNGVGQKLSSKNNDLISQLTEKIADDGIDTGKNLATPDLQSKINKLITSKNSSSSSSNYRKELAKEAGVRKNAVRSIIIKKGETLWSISKRAYGDGKYYKKILKANPQITRDGVLKLTIGQKIRVPI